MNNQRRQNNPWNREDSKNVPKKTNTSVPKHTAEQKFREAQKKLQESVQKHTQNYESSSDEEDLESENVIGSVLQNYSQLGGKDLGRTQRYLEEAFISGAATCLICIATVKRSDPIWSCLSCYCFFHLNCIQRWAKDSVIHQKRALEDVPNPKILNLFWGCPKCRHEYEPSASPNSYMCFCNKLFNPPYHPWLVPHSCGENCGKKLQPECGHECILLCHPGPCPPCPKTVNTKCFCSKKQKSQRCSNSEWSCASVCSKTLPCNKHKCAQNCHPGECNPCPQRSKQPCDCKAQSQMRECAKPRWKCGKVCNKQLSCGNHHCTEICHTDSCGECPKSGVRVCPCGKSTFQLPCTEDTPTCGDTCGKPLECGSHHCLQRCHFDKCGNCLEVLMKTCRCGLHSKELPCQKEFLCETKCKQIRDCGKHPCNRKCCDGSCPPCEKPCGRTLQCGTHKCPSACHRGPCYPCPRTVDIKCHCGGTVVTVPCGKQRKTRPPRCIKLCRNLPDCHHTKREAHRCHFGECPPCKQICNILLLNCNHHCGAPCHASVLVKLDEHKPSMPWEARGPLVEKCALPCPSCPVPIPVTCYGQHETIDVPCHEVRALSCGRSCGRKLDCGNHTCGLECHVVKNAENDEKVGTNCQVCESKCTKPRPEGCAHNCPKPCHPGDCPPCRTVFRIRCYCGLNLPYISCGDWTDPDKQDKLKNCGNQCPKNYECGHRCRMTCHDGDCLGAEECHKKVKVFCACKRLKREFHCDVVRSGNGTIDCDEICAQKQEEIRKAVEFEFEQKRKLEEEKNKKDVLEFEKKFQSKKKYRERRQYNEVEEQSLYKKYWFVMPFIVAISFGIYLIFYK